MECPSQKYVSFVKGDATTSEERNWCISSYDLTEEKALVRIEAEIGDAILDLNFI